MNRLRGTALAWALILLVLGSGVSDDQARAVEILLKDGRVLKGALGPPLSGVAEVPKAPSLDGTGPVKLIVMVDDDLRRTFVSKRHIQELLQNEATEILEKFSTRRRGLRHGPTVRSVGPVKVEPFDQYGGRILRMSTPEGTVAVIQTITEITPRWTKVEGVKHVWDMRVATSSIPRDVLDKILARQVDPENIEHRKKLARFFLQAERYEEASAELERILADFSDDDGVRKQIEPSIRALKQLNAQRLLSELKLRREAGQHRLVVTMLGADAFPVDGVAGELLQEVRETLAEYQALEARRIRLLEQFDSLVDGLRDSKLRQRIEPIRHELGEELGLNTLGRMAAFGQMSNDETITPEEKLALGISGWLLGSNAATLKLPVALSLFEVRNLARQYLDAPDRLAQSRILDLFREEEAAAPKLVAGLIANMKPPIETPLHSDEKPGYFELEVPSRGTGVPVQYLVQLPPEYDPLRRYPTLLVLHGAGMSPELELDWWAGPWSGQGSRRGQAGRHGYIVIAPAWTTEHQRHYEYSYREYAAVRDCLRNACQRFAIDTDRVFLAGYSMGGDAAWDIGLAHPDLWAGVIPFAARNDRYCTRYWENAKRLPFYFVCGELDGDKMAQNATSLDRYLERAYDVTVVEYRGRGHEHFSDEIQQVFEWLGRLRRDFYPREFQTNSMRPWDNVFWWVELAGLPPKTQVHPIDWPPPHGTIPAKTKATITATNGITIRTGANHVTVWLSPEMLDFDERVNVNVNGRRLNARMPFVEGDLETLLEDVRARADRQHPFWFKIDSSISQR